MNWAHIAIDLTLDWLGKRPSLRLLLFL